MSEGVLAATFREAVILAEAMRADGAAPDAIQEAIATALRAAWPRDREEPWHYVCGRCDDSGWVFRTCVSGSCGRPFKLPKQGLDDYTGRGRCRDGHGYVEPCWCAKGQAFKRQMFKEPRPLEDAVEAAAKTSKPARLGR